MTPFKVIVTGFGPFRDHKVNASWVAVKTMKDTGGLGEDIDLEIIQIDVDYAFVDSEIPKIWKKKPKLMIHVGVSGRATAITLEECARNGLYQTADIKGKCPKHNICKKSGQECIESTINMEGVVEKVKAVDPELAVTTSRDAGRYLCEYIYYSSLAKHKAPCAFIHVPPLNGIFSGQQLADSLRAVIKQMIEQIRQQS